MSTKNITRDLFDPHGGFQQLIGRLIVEGVREFGGVEKLSDVAHRVSEAARAIVIEALPEGREATQLHQAIVSSVIFGATLESAVPSTAPDEKEA